MMRWKPAVIASVAAVAFTLQTGAGLSQQQPNAEVAALRCAAGLGCMTQCEMLEALGLSSSDDARNRYASEHPADYVREVEKLSGEAPESCVASQSAAAGASSASGAGATVPGNTARPENPSEPAKTDTEYTSWEGYSETSCPGTRLDDPRFVMQRPLRVLACFKGEDGSFTECGMNPARAVCLMNGYSDVACYGVDRAEAAANVDAVCQNGSCPAFTYVVCK